MKATGEDSVSKCAHYFRLTDRTGPSSRFKPQNLTHMQHRRTVLLCQVFWGLSIEVILNHRLLSVTARFGCFCHTVHRCVDNCKQGQRARKHNEVLILARGVVSHAQDMKAQAQTWRKSSFLWHEDVIFTVSWWFSTLGLSQWLLQCCGLLLCLTEKTNREETEGARNTAGVNTKEK